MLRPKPFHPAVPVTAGFVLILLLQRLQGIPLLVALVFCAGACVLSARSHWWRLIRRLRYMLLVLVVLFAWQTPGVLLWPALGGWSPTEDGLRLACEHAARIMLVVSVVAFMLHKLAPAQWVQGLYGLSAPLRRFGFPAERFALRLQLVLQDAEQADRTAWREALAPQVDACEAAAPLALFALAPRDAWIMLALIGVGVWGLA